MSANAVDTIAGKPISLNTKTATGGGLLNNADVEILDIAWTLDLPSESYTFDGQHPVFLRAKFKDLSSGAEVDSHTTYWSHGTIEHFVPSEPDGRKLLAAGEGGRDTMVKGSNAYLFLNSLQTNCRMPDEKLNGDLGVKALVGARISVIRAVPPGRDGMASSKTKTGRDRDVLIARDVISWPWDKKATTGSGKAAGKAPAAAAVEAAEAAGGPDESEAGELAKETLLGMIVTAKNEQVAAGADLVKAMFKLLVAAKTNKVLRQDACALAGQEDWLTANGFAVEDGMVSVAE